MHEHRPYYPPVHGLLAKLFASFGHEVTILTTALPDGGAGVIEEDCARIHYLSGTKPGSEDPRSWPISAAAFDRLHQEKPFDLIFGRGAATAGFHEHSRFSGQVPAISHEGTYPIWLHQLERRLPSMAGVLAPPLALVWFFHKRVYRACLRQSEVVVCNSPALARALRRVYWWAPPRTDFIPYGFDLAPWLAASAQPVPAGPPRIAFVGRLTWDKGALAMIDILAQMQRRDAVIEAIGPMSDKVRRALQRRAAERGVADRFLTPGPEKNANLPQRLHGAAAYLFPSTHPEGLSKSVMEAMAAGLPVVAYQMPGMDTLVDSGVTGWIVPSRDTAAAARRLDALLDDPAAAGRMGQAARQRLERDFSPLVVSARWQKLLTDVVTGFKSRRSADS